MPDSTDYSTILDRGVQLRIQAKALEEEAEAMKTEANQLFTIALNMSGESKLTHDRGTVRRKFTSRTTLNKERLVNVLVEKGVKANVVADSISEATDVKEYESIEFRSTK